MFIDEKIFTVEQHFNPLPHIFNTVNIYLAITKHKKNVYDSMIFRNNEVNSKYHRIIDICACG